VGRTEEPSRRDDKLVAPLDFDGREWPNRERTELAWSPYDKRAPPLTCNRCFVLTARHYILKLPGRDPPPHHQVQETTRLTATMMPQLRSLVALVLVATAIAAAPGVGFVVTGRIYCDNCRAGFETNVSHAIQGEHYITHHP
jgi:hypothetical protein